MIFAIGCASHRKNEKPEDKPPPNYTPKERVGEASVPTPAPTPAEGLLFRPVDAAGEAQDQH
jgi:hypothetical protein